MYSALVAKLRRINEIMKHSQSFRRVNVPKRKVFATVALLLVIQVAILLVWQTMSPLKWEVEEVIDGYQTTTIGRCTSENVYAFAGACALFIGFCLAYALNLAYKTRNIPTDFAEGKYIAFSAGYLLQLLMLGVPILVIASDNKNAYFAVLSLILFLTSFGTSLLIFVPKLAATKKSKVDVMGGLSGATTTMKSTADGA